MTQKIFYKEPYTKELIAKILRVNDKKVFLDKTIFYPMLLDPGIKGVGSNIDENKSRIDLGYEPTITPEIRQKLEDRCNELINKKLSVKCWWDEVKPDFRWTQIGDLPKLPCGGLHVKDLEEIGTLKIIKRESKGKGKQRLEFVLE